MVTEMRLWHWAKAASLMLFTPLGIVIEVKSLQVLKAYSPIVTRLSGRVIVLRLHSVNAPRPILVIPSEIVTEVSSFA